MNPRVKREVLEFARMRTRSPEEVLVERLRDPSLVPEGQGKVLAERAGISEATLSRWRSGRERPNPKLDSLARLASVLRVPVSYLISDEHPAVEHFEANGEDFATLPVLVEVAAGRPIFAVRGVNSTVAGERQWDTTQFHPDHPDDSFNPSRVPEDFEEPTRLAFRTSWLQQSFGTVDERHVFLARVRGDSMHPTIRDKAIVLVQRWYPPTQEDLAAGARAVENGAIYLLQDGEDGHTVKRLALTGPVLTVYADNPSYQAYSVDIEERDARELIIGRVRWVGHKE